MHRWMQRAAGGTSQRLKPALAMMRSRSRSPAGAPTRLPARSIVVMRLLSVWRPFFDKVVVQRCREPDHKQCGRAGLDLEHGLKAVEAARAHDLKRNVARLGVRDG